MNNRIDNIRNLVRTGSPVQRKMAEKSSLANYISPVQLQRLAQDTRSWRAAIAEAERAWYPERVKMQQMFIDTILNGHVYSLMERRKDLTMLRDFSIVDEKDNESEVLSEQFREAEWFQLFIAYAMDALFFGYSLISLGDCIGSDFPDLSIIKRWHISPDRNIVQPFIYSPNGKSFLEKPYSDWHIWVKTPSDNGASQVGYGLFYQIALYEIFLKNTLGFNGDFVELYSQPYRVGKTTKTNETERAQLEQALQSMGSSGYAIIDPTDEISFLEANLAGTGWKGYENLEQRCEKKVSKIILGHADAIDSTPGKLGAGQSGGGSKDGASMDGSPVQMALNDKQTKDGRFVSALVNKQLLPRLRKIGFSIPENYKFKFKNDQEKEEFRQREDQSNLTTAQIAQTMKTAGLQMDAQYFQERTGIPTEKIEIPAPLAIQPDKKEDKPEESSKPQEGKATNKFSQRIKNKLNRLYA